MTEDRVHLALPIPARHRDFKGRFPNGRAPQDDVVALTAHYGDALAYELSFVREGPNTRLGNAPRLAVHDPPVETEFPYLLPKRSVTVAASHHHLSQEQRESFSWRLYYSFWAS